MELLHPLEGDSFILLLNADCTRSLFPGTPCWTSSSPLGSIHTEIWLSCSSPRDCPSAFAQTTAQGFAKAVREWLHRFDVGSLFIEPGSPWENGCRGSLNGKLRDELLTREIFYPLEEGGVLAENWRREYNMIRPHSSLEYRVPAPEALGPEVSS